MLEVLKRKHTTFKLRSTVKNAESVWSEGNRVRLKIVQQYIDDSFVPFEHSEMYGHIPTVRFLIFHQVKSALNIVFKEFSEVLKDALSTEITHSLKDIQRMPKSKCHDV